MKFTLYTANCTGNEKNVLYPNQKVITSEADLKKAVVYDHVCAQYENFARSDANFLLSDVVPMDCDNDHSDDPKDWITPQFLADNLCDVAFAVTYSRHHMLAKGDKSARPRFHVFFPTSPCKNATMHNVWRSRSPVRHDLFQFRIRHSRSTHGFHCSDRAAVATCQFCDLAFLP